MYKLKTVGGIATFLLRAGKDLVKNQMPAASARHIIEHGVLKNSNVPGFPINVEDKWYFEGEPVEEESTAKSRKNKPLE